MNEEILIRIIYSESDDLKTLALLAGGRPESFYRGTNFSGADLRGEDLENFDLTGSSFTGAIIDRTTKINKKYRPRVLPSENTEYCIITLPICSMFRIINRNDLRTILRQHRKETTLCILYLNRNFNESIFQMFFQLSNTHSSFKLIFSPSRFGLEINISALLQNFLSQSEVNPLHYHMIFDKLISEYEMYMKRHANAGVVQIPMICNSKIEFIRMYVRIRSEDFNARINLNSFDLACSAIVFHSIALCLNQYF